jgi:hypothetical protein
VKRATFSPDNCILPTEVMTCMSRANISVHTRFILEQRLPYAPSYEQIKKITENTMCFMSGGMDKNIHRSFHMT